MNQKMSAELAAEKGVILGEPYTPPGRTGSFDVPSYDDIADLNQLFKRFANTAVANGGDTMIGTYNIAGSLYINGLPLNPSDAYALVDKTSGFSVSIPDVLAQTRFMCNFATDQTIGVPADGSMLPDGARVTLVQAGKGRFTVGGLNVVGTLRSSLQYSTLEVMWHGGVWWCLAGAGGGGGGGTGTPSAPSIGFTGFDFTTISWAAVNDGTGGPTFGYGALTAPSGVVYKITGDNPVNMAISRVPSNTEVTFEVWAVNAAGRSESSNTLTHMYPAVAATAITGASRGGAVLLNWNSVPDVTEWDIEYRKQSNPQWTLVEDVPPSALTFTVTGLDEVPYLFRMYAVVGAAFSDASNVVTVTPGPALPPAGPVLSHVPGAPGAWTIDNYDPTYLYSASISTGAAPVIVGNKMTTTVPDAEIVVSVRRTAGGLVASTKVQFTPYTWPYTAGYYQCDNQTYDYCDGNSGYCPCGTWHESEGSCSGWVCHAGHDVPGYFSIGGNPGAGWSASSNAGATYGSIPSPLPGEWYRTVV